MRAQHGVGHGVERNRQVQIGAVLAPSIQASPRPAVQRRAGQPSPLPSTHTSPQRPSTLTAATTAEPSIQCSPSICGISPPSTSGKQASFAALSRAHYVLAESGNQQPRTLAGAFARSVTGDDLMAASIEALTQFRAQLNTAYGPGADASAEMRVGGTGSLADVVAFGRG
jgi:hypothetical protein